jgi:hypothetical protein
VADAEITPALEQAVRDLDRHVSASGWNQPTRLFAVADTQTLLQNEPALASQLAGGPDEHPFTTIEQEGFPQHQELDEMLRGIAWPATVTGAAISTERTMVQPALGDADTSHEVRITMMVLRDGSRRTTLRLREHDHDDSVILGDDLVSGLGDLLLHTFAPDVDH